MYTSGNCENNHLLAKAYQKIAPIFIVSSIFISTYIRNKRRSLIMRQTNNAINMLIHAYKTILSNCYINEKLRGGTSF